MSKRQETVEARIVAFFTEVDLPVALSMYRGVRGILDARGAFKLGAERKVRVKRLKGEVPLPFPGGPVVEPLPDA